MQAGAASERSCWKLQILNRPILPSIEVTQANGKLLLTTGRFSAKLEHMSDKMIRASEIAEYVYCRRAWWLSRVAGYAAENAELLQEGAAFHRDHGSRLRRVVIARRVAYLLVFAAVTVFVFLLVRGA